MKKISKILSIVLCLAMVMGLAVMASAAETTPTIADGEYVIVCPAYNKALSSEKTSHYNVGVDVTISGNTVSGYGETEKWTVTNNADGSITISQNGQKLAMADSYSSLNLGEVNDKWVLEDAGNGLYYVKNAVRGNYIEWYDSYGNWSSYNKISDSTKDLFALSFISLKAAEPEIPEVPAEPTIVDISTALAGNDGDEFMVKGVVTLIDGKNVYLQDATGGICVRASANVEDLAMGDTVIGTGKKSVYNGLVQLSGSYEKSSGMTLTAKETTIDALTTADIGTYIKLSGVTVTEVFDNDGAYSSPNVKVSDGTNEIQIYKAVVVKNNDGTWAYQVGDVVDVYAAVSCYKTTLQLRNTVAEEIVVAGAEAPSFIGTPSQNPGEVNPGAGDMSIAGLVIALTAAAGCAVVLTKKKEF